MNKRQIAKELIKIAKEINSSLGSNIPERSRKREIITQIRMGLSAQGLGMAELMKQTKGYERKSVEELESIWHDLHTELKKQNLVRANNKTARNISARKIEIRKIDDKEVARGTSLFDLPIVFKGNYREIIEWAREQGLKWVRDSKSIFKGYWNDYKNNISYMPT